MLSISSQVLEVDHVVGSLVGFVTGPGRAMIANLNQNPQKKAVVGSKLPTLLRQGVMFLLLGPERESSENQEPHTHTIEERWMLPKDS